MGVIWHGYFISFMTLLYSVSYGKTTGERHPANLVSGVSAKPKLLLLSIEGLRGDYLARINCSNLRKFVNDGTSASYVQNSINVASISNYYSMVTGLYPESHGVVANTMFDPKLKRVFNSETREDPEWWVNVHPVWKEIENQGRGLSALCHWPGVYGPMVSTLRCAEKTTLKADIDQAVKWLKNGVKLVLLHSDDIKKVAVKYGPYSQQAIDEVKKLDSLLKYLVEKTNELNVNVLLTSDSGVTDLKWDHVIDLDRCIDPKSYVLIQAQATLLLYSKQGYTSEDIYKNLTQCPHMRAYLKSNLPQHFHYSHNRRIPPVVAFVPLGSVVRSSKPMHRNINEILNGSKRLQRDMGGSGYHPGYEVMRGIFYANGPSFQTGLKYDAINSTDLYAIICSVLGLTPQPNNASFHVAKAMLKRTKFEVSVNTLPTSTSQPNSTLPRTKWIKIYSRNHGLFGDLELRGFLIFLGCAAGVMVLLCCVGCLNSMRKNMKGEFQRKASVYPPLLNTELTSSDED